MKKRKMNMITNMERRAITRKKDKTRNTHKREEENLTVGLLNHLLKLTLKAHLQKWLK
jgi:hypothetical protein